jgi:hypothetical protein
MSELHLPKLKVSRSNDLEDLHNTDMYPNLWRVGDSFTPVITPYCNLGERNTLYSVNNYPDKLLPLVEIDAIMAFWMHVPGAVKLPKRSTENPFNISAKEILKRSSIVQAHYAIWKSHSEETVLATINDEVYFCTPPISGIINTWNISHQGYPDNLFGFYGLAEIKSGFVELPKRPIVLAVRPFNLNNLDSSRQQAGRDFINMMLTKAAQSMEV